MTFGLFAFERSADEFGAYPWVFRPGSQSQRPRAVVLYSGPVAFTIADSAGGFVLPVRSRYLRRACRPESETMKEEKEIPSAAELYLRTGLSAGNVPESIEDRCGYRLHRPRGCDCTKGIRRYRANGRWRSSRKPQADDGVERMVRINCTRDPYGMADLQAIVEGARPTTRDNVTEGEVTGRVARPRRVVRRARRRYPFACDHRDEPWFGSGL